MIPPDYSRTWSNIHIWGGFSSLKEFISFEYSEKSPHHSLLTCWQVWDRCIINICRYDLDVNERLSMSIGVSPVTKCRIQVLCIPCLVYMTNFVLNNFTIQIIKLCPESVFSSFQHFMFYSEAPWAVRATSFTWYNTGNVDIFCSIIEIHDSTSARDNSANKGQALIDKRTMIDMYMYSVSGLWGLTSPLTLIIRSRQAEKGQSLCNNWKQ